MILPFRYLHTLEPHIHSSSITLDFPLSFFSPFRCRFLPGPWARKHLITHNFCQTAFIRCQEYRIVAQLWLECNLITQSYPFFWLCNHDSTLFYLIFFILIPNFWKREVKRKWSLRLTLSSKWTRKFFQ